MGPRQDQPPGQKIDLSPRTPNVPALHALPRSSSRPPRTRRPRSGSGSTVASASIASGNLDGKRPRGWSPPRPSPGPGWVEATWSTGPTVRLRRAIETRTRPPTYLLTNAKGAVGVTAGTQTARPGRPGEG